MMQMTALEKLDDDELETLCREREVAFGDALAELAKRRDWYGCEVWSDESALALLAEGRKGNEIPRRPKGTAPLLWRAGYEWAAQSIFRILDSVLRHPSSEIASIISYEHVGKGLFRPVGKPRIYDGRRRAAMDLIEMLEGFVKIDLRAFFELPRRRSSYRPTIDDEAEFKRRATANSERASPILSTPASAERKP